MKFGLYERVYVRDVTEDKSYKGTIVEVGIKNKNWFNAIGYKIRLDHNDNVIWAEDLDLYSIEKDFEKRIEYLEKYILQIRETVHVPA